ncbi:PAP2 domain protein [Rasamsonia emersonii CBS 393.64]|uniref:PAP2 domain protein n=1 Tax=Rasamsonia emersonii (strain ATCC 16479 / CBS 393.64 / IMI 116815) TaxID=1408163 RepID=A0A0F4Z573_RASE3|nr:PAP2 domain protein [Rasamsonia emersonii CBS 393.64]KKA25231.1 PAP2 domain protein [Rasamsonia emersonii CBS 393.64]
MPLSTQPGAAGALARFWRRTYAPDYVALSVVAVGWVMIQLFVHPFHRMFSLDNVALQYPFAQVERVSVYRNITDIHRVWSVIYAGVIPLIILVLWGIFFRPDAHKFHVTVLGLVVTLAVGSFITDLIKNAVGRPRPDLIDRCKPGRGTPDHELVTYTVCTQPNQHILDEGWRSFPSGHSSFAFGGLGYLAMFFAGQMHVFRPRADLARCLLVLAPLLGALMIAISRCEDYRHDVWDVTCGGLLGITVAYMSYRRYYPPLRSVRCHVPYDKSDVPLVDGFSKLADDEERQESRSHRTSPQWQSPEESFQLEEPADQAR